MLESWQCTFSTNLLHGLPDPYVWVVLSPEFPELASRELIEPSKLHPQTPNAIKEKIAHPLGVMFVERCIKGPEIWAKELLRSKLDELKREYSESVQKFNTDLCERVAQVLAEMRTEVTKEKETVERAGNWWLFDKEEDLNNWLQQLKRLEKEAQEKSVSQLDSFRLNADPIIQLLGNICQSGCEDQYEEIPLCFSSELANFHELEIQYQETRRVTRLLDLAWKRQESFEDSDKKCARLESQIATLQGDQSSLKGKLDSSQNENQILHQEIAKLKKQIPNPKKRKQMGWEIYSLIAVSVIALGLASVIGVNYNKSKRDEPTTPPKATSQKEKNITIVGEQDTNQKQNIAEEDNTIKKLRSDLESAKKEKEKLTEERDKVTGERNKSDDDLRKSNNALVDLRAKNKELEQKLTALETANQAKKANGKSTVVQPSDPQKDTPPAPLAPNTPPSDGKSGNSQRQ